LKLRSKLLFLTASAGLLFLASIAVYFTLLSPIGAMTKETAVVLEVERAAGALELQANLLVIHSLGTQRTAFLDARARYDQALESLAQVKALVSASPEIAEAVNAVKKLKILSVKWLDGVSTAVDAVMADAQNAGLNAQSTTWAQVAQAAYGDTMKEVDQAKFDLGKLMNQVSSLNESLTLTVQVIQAKDLVIQEGIAAIQDRSTQTGLAVILVALVVALVLSSLIAQGLSKAFQGLGATVARVGAGDLRLRFESKRKDELGTLGHDFDSFLDSLTGAFRRIQEASAENLQVKDQLVTSVSSATSSAVEIEANSQSILGQLKKADERIQASLGDLNQVVSLQEAFLVRLDGQNQSISESTKAVNELTVGIGRITDLSHGNRRAVEALLSESDRGREIFEHSFSKVAEINESVSAIQDLVGAIADIAGQTNILSLNAAIEAAHAGVAGKGFAVVADEISKLATASATSSAQINTTIQEVVAKIREAGATRGDTLQAFEAIDAQIERVSEQGRGIYEAVDQMNQGTDRIHNAMDSLSTNSQETSQHAGRISLVAAALGETLGEVGRISHEVVSNIGEITSGLGEISRTVSEVAAQSDRLGRTGEALDQAVNAFRTNGG